MLGAKYTSGPFVVGIAGEIGWYQGTVTMSGLSQRLGRTIDVGAGYYVAPGFMVYAEYPMERHVSGRREPDYRRGWLQREQ